MVGTCYAGPVEEGERVLEPLRQFGSPLLDRCAPMPFTKHQALLDPSFPHELVVLHPLMQSGGAHR